MGKLFLHNKVIVVTGAAGSIGSALCRRIARQNPKNLLLLDCDETGIFDIYEELKDRCRVEYIIATIRERETIYAIFKKHRPQIVIHAAAYKHVALMERYPDEARKTNIDGLANVFDASDDYDVEKFVFISSDKAVKPTSVMGKTKKEGENIVLSSPGKMKAIVVRFGNVMPSRGSVVPVFQRQIAEGRDLTVTSPKMKRYFMGIYDAVELVLEATKIGNDGDIFVLDMGEEIKISDLAKLLIKVSGKDLSIRYTKPSSGEKFREELMTAEELKRAKKIGKLWVIKSR